MIAWPFTGDEQAMACSLTTRRVIETAIIIILALLPVATELWFPILTQGGSLGFDDAPSGKLLAALADTSRLTSYAVQPSTRVDADGTTADTSTRDYRSPAIAGFRGAVAHACIPQGRSAPRADDRRMMPDLVCQGQWRGHDTTVHLNGRCEGACIATLEPRIIQGDTDGQTRP